MKHFLRLVGLFAGVVYASTTWALLENGMWFQLLASQLSLAIIALWLTNDSGE